MPKHLKQSLQKISITGDLGSGKSVVSRLLSERTGYPIYSTGDIQRKIAVKHGMTTLELNKYTESHPEIDDEIDAFSKNLNNSEEPFIIDSRIAWHFIPTSFKIYLQVSTDIAAKRILSDKDRKSEFYSNLEEAKASIISRRDSENKRFLELYGVDRLDMKNYDLVVDTSYKTPEQVVQIILKNR